MFLKNFLCISKIEFSVRIKCLLQIEIERNHCDLQSVIVFYEKFVFCTSSVVHDPIEYARFVRINKKNFDQIENGPFLHRNFSFTRQ